MVDVDGGAMQDGRKVQEWTYNGSGAQQWRLRSSGTHYRIEAVPDAAYCLGREHAGDLARVVLRRCADGLTDWRFQALGGERYQSRTRPVAATCTCGTRCRPTGGTW